jgi:VCBS repeat-containing protein
LWTRTIWKSDRFSHFWDSSGQKISLFDNKFNPIGTVNTDDKGNYTFSVECGKTYNVRAEKEAYTTKESVTIADEDGKTNLDIA